MLTCITSIDNMGVHFCVEFGDNATNDVLVSKEMACGLPEYIEIFGDDFLI